MRASNPHEGSSSFGNFDGERVGTPRVPTHHLDSAPPAQFDGLGRHIDHAVDGQPTIHKVQDGRPVAVRTAIALKQLSRHLTGVGDFLA